MRVAFLTTIFPMNKQYLYDFFNSLVEQTYKNFEIIVVNDGYEYFEEIKKSYNKNLKIIELQYSNTPAKNREYGINYCIDNKYDILIFGDSDDFFQKNRVEKSLELLKENDIVVNDLSLFDERGIYEEKYISNRLENLQEIDFEFIKDKNIFGLSNTAINLNNLEKIILPEHLIAVDWYIFTILLVHGKKAIFTNETVSFYRQYQENIVGIKEIDENSFQKGVDVKRRHYEVLNKISKQFDLELKRLNNLEIYNVKRIKNPLWWELI
ncbi:glycosyltransferase [Aliarcobacter butzleri]|uniref:glycosyltransferase n=1 Tax=Aliarcobacter butzleri TaxID=28197 RepID=UPI00263CFBCB|nr:glycosyltransferase [Aliarcobacter butzleri]MDN5059235.1 glycosyltransferase [Aliarcobacter butzleri]